MRKLNLNFQSDFINTEDEKSFTLVKHLSLTFYCRSTKSELEFFRLYHCRSRSHSRCLCDCRHYFGHFVMKAKTISPIRSLWRPQAGITKESRGKSWSMLKWIVKSHLYSVHEKNFQCKPFYSVDSTFWSLKPLKLFTEVLNFNVCRHFKKLSL